MSFDFVDYKKDFPLLMQQDVAYLDSAATSLHKPPQVARAVGYESQSKFSAEFKKVFGMLPSEFRKLHAGH